MLVVIPNSQKCLDGQVYIVLKGLTILWSAHDLYHLKGEFEVGWFELHVVCRRDVKDEPEVDVDEVPLLTDQYVPIVPIFDLQDVADDTIGSLALDEILPGHLEV